MKLYDRIINNIIDSTSSYGAKVTATEDTDWEEISDRSMILKSDMAFELGDERGKAVGLTLITDSRELVPEDSVTVIGPDLKDIKGEKNYARISIVRVNPQTIGEGEKLYNAIRKLEYVRYHFYPKGYMMRVSSSKHRESVRVGKDALASGLTFNIVGSMMANAFKKDPNVEAVRNIYITDDTYDYITLESLAKESEGITKTIDHIFNTLNMDCSVCNLQEICDEVEGLKELHFKKGE